MDFDELRTLLKFEGIDLSDYSDKELKILIDSKSREITGLTGLDITPVHRRQYITKFKGRKLRLDFYPVKDIVEINYSKHELNHHDYHIDKDLGLISFNKPLHGSVEILYLSGVSDDVQKSLIEPLIRDMVAYTVTYNQHGFGDGISSIHEGDVSINYDTSNNRGNKISNRVDDIKARYSTGRLRWL